MGAIRRGNFLVGAETNHQSRDVLQCNAPSEGRVAGVLESATHPVETVAATPIAAGTAHERLHAPLRPQELNRRLLHALPGFFPYLFYFFPQADPLEAWSLWVVTATCAAGAIGSLMMRRAFRRTGEQGWAVSVLSFTTIVPVLVWLFPGKSEIACAVVSIIAFGDGFATLAGMLFGSRSLPWNAAKSMIGSAAFVAGSLPLAVFSFWLQARPAVPLTVAFACVAPAVLLAAIGESLPSRINDNIRIGVIASATIVAMHRVMIGG